MEKLADEILKLEKSKNLSGYGMFQVLFLRFIKAIEHHNKIIQQTGWGENV